MEQLRSREISDVPGSHICDWQGWDLNSGSPAPQPLLGLAVLGGHPTPPPGADAVHVDTVWHPYTPHPRAAAALISARERRARGDPVSEPVPGFSQLLYPSHPHPWDTLRNHLVPALSEATKLSLIGPHRAQKKTGEREGPAGVPGCVPGCWGWGRDGGGWALVCTPVKWGHGSPFPLPSSVSTQPLVPKELPTQA